MPVALRLPASASGQAGNHTSHPARSAPAGLQYLVSPGLRQLRSECYAHPHGSGPDRLARVPETVSSETRRRKLRGPRRPTSAARSSAKPRAIPSDEVRLCCPGSTESAGHESFARPVKVPRRSEEHTSELQSPVHL